MKRLFTLLSTALVAVMTLSLTSCDEDQLIGLRLDGTWEGDVYMYYEYGGHTYRATRTVVEFDSSLSLSHGTGYWIDYYSGAPWDYTASHIRWTVVDRTIRIHFIEDNYDIYIYDYSVNDRRFSGVIEGEDGKRLTFSLFNTDPQDWDDYSYGWHSYSYGYSKPADFTRSAEQADSCTATPVRHVGL